MTVLVATSLRKNFGGVAAVDGVSFSVAAGELVALIGPNGAGKSTCFNLLNGQIRPDAGHVQMNGLDITGLPPARLAQAGMARSFQVAAVFVSMTVRENVQTAIAARAGKIWNLWRDAAGQHIHAADKLLAAAGLATLANTAAGLLAYSDRKRLEFAIALAGQPTLLLMDEPTAGMAADARAALMQLVQAIAKRRNIAVLFTEHDMHSVFAVADRILVLHQGKLIAEGDAAGIQANPQVRSIYLGIPA